MRIGFYAVPAGAIASATTAWRRRARPPFPVLAVVVATAEAAITGRLNGLRIPTTDRRHARRMGSVGNWLPRIGLLGVSSQFCRIVA